MSRRLYARKLSLMHTTGIRFVDEHAVVVVDARQSGEEEVMTPRFDAVLRSIWFSATN